MIEFLVQEINLNRSRDEVADALAGRDAASEVRAADLNLAGRHRVLLDQLKSFGRDYCAEDFQRGDEAGSLVDQWQGQFADFEIGRAHV